MSSLPPLGTQRLLLQAAPNPTFFRLHADFHFLPPTLAPPRLSHLLHLLNRLYISIVISNFTCTAAAAIHLQSSCSIEAALRDEEVMGDEALGMVSKYAKVNQPCPFSKTPPKYPIGLDCLAGHLLKT